MTRDVQPKSPEQNYSWKSNSSSASQETSFTLRDLKVRHFVRNSPSLCWARWIQTTPSHSTAVYILILPFQLYPVFPSYLFPSSFPTTTLRAFPFSPIRVTCPAHLILLGRTFGTIFDEQYIAGSSSLRGFLQFNWKIMTESSQPPAVTSSLV